MKHSVANFFGGMGMMVRRGMIDRETTLDLFSNLALDCWKKTAPLIAVERR